MRIRIDHKWGAIATLIAGGVYATLIHINPQKMFISWIALADDAVSAFLIVAAMAGGVGLGAERIGSRADGRAWGIGRLFWSLSAMSMVLAGCRLVIERPWREWQPENIAVNRISRLVFEKMRDEVHELSFYLFVVFVASLLARFPRDAAPDSREWSGRVFGSLVIAWGAAYSLIVVCRAKGLE